MTITQKAYLAGLIDGDGSLMLQFKRRKDTKLPFRIKATIAIYQDQKCINTLREIQQLLGTGYISQRNDHMCELRIEGFNQVIKLLTQLEPYLKFKKQQAKLMLNALELLVQFPNSVEILLQISKISDQISSLNYLSKTRKYTSSYILEELRRLNLLPVTTGFSPNGEMKMDFKSITRQAPDSSSQTKKGEGIVYTSGNRRVI